MIQMAPFEALYGRKCHSLVCRDNFIKSATLGLEMFVQMTEKVKLIRDKLR